ncbi:MAG TPA: gamma-glutamyl-phosphate reductase, partial [Beijerinckiaceae bacterium]|nr:gamma-glutamyl-phosphate reductase [Beijerinckiaceae bacterium]
MDKLQLIHGGRHEPAQDVKTLMRDLGSQARKSSRALALAPSSRKNLALMVAAASVRTASSQIVEANELDIKDAEAAGATPAALDRLKLDAARIEAIA